MQALRIHKMAWRSIMIALAISLLCSSRVDGAQCNVKPSANAFFSFMKEVKTTRLHEGETLLRAEADTLACKPVFKLKVLDKRGQVQIRYYDAETFNEVVQPKEQQKWGLDSALDAINAINPLSSEKESHQQ